MASNDREYNGWTNYETWCFNLWMDNEEGGCRYWKENTEQACRDNVDGNKVDRDAASYELAAMSKEYAEQAIESADVHGFLADLLGAAVSEINFEEVARHWIDDNADDIDEELASEVDSDSDEE